MEGNRAAFKEAEAFPPLNYEKKGGTIDLSFWRAPDACSTNPMSLSAWAPPRWRRRVGRGEERTDGAEAKSRPRS